ncbi:hypothetical protein TcasGA2_TC034628 [Tribolium castaneum]|uniref:Choline transporter-like protein n=1 Tax=Tribolium castaneum TaxID=7070 RepID=A0A139WJY8_TRICA|nr:hypothetical protein TcasGA2_TC034628 [Tribolium castaneum]
MANSNRGKPIVVENIATFRRSQSPLDVFVIPELSQKRKLTDVPFLITLAICVVVLMIAMIYTLYYSDMNRFTNGYDNCGNVCGEKNSHVDGIPCSGQDMTNKPYLVGGKCVERCADADCSTSDVWNEFNEKLGPMAIVCCIGLGLSIIALFCFRYFVDVFVWTMLIGAVLLMCALTGYIWYCYANQSSEQGSGLLIGAIIFTFISLIFAVFILVLKDMIKLIIRFYEETIKMVFAMPLILLEPVLTFISIFVIVGLCVYTFILMNHAGKLQETGDSSYPYRIKASRYTKDSVLPVVIGAVFAFLCIHCIFVVFEIDVDAVFICYCEDNCLNNGTTEPFYATVEFYQQVKKAQAVTKSIEAKKKKK